MFCPPPPQLRYQRSFSVSATVKWSQIFSSGSASLTQPHHTISPFRMPAPYPNRTLLPRRPWITRCQPCCSHSGRWLVFAQRKLEELPISPLRMSLFCVFFLVILVSSLPGNPQALDCDSYMCTTWAWIAVTKTLVFHTYYSCAGTIVGSCTHNHTTYSVCFHDGQYICFNPIYCPQEQWLKVQFQQTCVHNSWKHRALGQLWVRGRG
jgi:hypothetical protein